MNGYLWAALALWAATFCGRLLTESLRNFSRKRLATFLKGRGREDEDLVLEIITLDTPLEIASASLTSLLFGAAVLLTGYGFLLSHAAMPPAELAIWGVFFAGVIVVGMVLLPRAVSLVAAEGLLVKLWPVLRAALRVAAPLTVTAGGLDTVALRLAAREEPDDSGDLIADEIETVVGEGEKDGTIRQNVSRMIKQIVDLADVDVREVMTPRTDFKTLMADTTIAEARRLFLEVGHSRIPVIGDSPDDLLGVVYAKDLLKVHDREDRRITDVEDLLRAPLFVPISSKVEKLLGDMRSQRMHMAIILDEYGGVVGMVTLEDILEEIVGDIADEYDPEKDGQELVIVDEQTIELDAKYKIDELNRAFDFGLPDDNEFETVGGFVFGELDRVPDVGDMVTWNALEFTVLAAEARRIVRLRLRRLDQAVSA